MAAYEYLLTSRHEYAFLFRRKWTGATWLFLTNRYVMLAIAIWQTTPSTASVSRPDMYLSDFMSLNGRFADVCLFKVRPCTNTDILTPDATSSGYHTTSSDFVLKFLLLVNSNLFSQDCTGYAHFICDSVFGVTSICAIES